MNRLKKPEYLIFSLNLAFHVLVTLVGLLFMPFEYFSESSLHDGQIYYEISQNLWPAQPFTLLSWHKRFLLPLLANIVFPWERHIAFWLIGVIPACLAAVYFYKIAKQYTENAIPLTIIFSTLPWLVLGAHHGLNEPLLTLFLLAGYYYFTQDKPFAYTICFALSLLSKELALLPITVMSFLIWKRFGYKRTLYFTLSVLPFGLFCLIYGWHWHDCLWCLKESSTNPLENSFSLKTGFYWIFLTLKTGTQSSANPTLALLYDIFNQGLNLILLAFMWIGAFKMRNKFPDLFIYNLVLLVGLLFLGRNQYMLSSSLGRQYLIASLTLVGYGSLLNLKTGRKNHISTKLLLILLVGSMIIISIFWIILYAKFFLVDRLF